jgi:hypothetical protein
MEPVRVECRALHTEKLTSNSDARSRTATQIRG